MAYQLNGAMSDSRKDTGRDMPTDSLTMKVTNYIFDTIHKDQLSAGESLPSELQTSKKLRISRGIVRESFKSLELAGVIEKANGRSPRVGAVDSSFLTHLLVHALSTRQISVIQVLQVRASIEVTAAELAARRRLRSDVQRLRFAVDGMRKSIEKPELFVQHDLDFHDVINGASGNALIEIFCCSMHECMQESMRVGLLRRRGKAGKMQVVATHAAIADAIEAGSASRAGKLMKKHFDDTHRVLGEMAAE